MKRLNTEDLHELKEHIENNYAGDYASLSLELSKAVYLLHYLEKDVIGQYDIQNTCFALQRLNECFHHAHYKKWREQFNN
ncbi:hypothetical protein C900_01211 [Fulvivirga imtechensis AK7]|uniref:Uncharacterized protein n=1 Tax=Fulvivirga imtechensis AK7 TaxID=1237149 RepID=L8JKT5_9BACT|nr:hypothetical protein [Fulvivirga imtechensis]ELR68037.1 hypothetical protein C900_01211 [Fulvivirga imtechensis AK7]